MLTFVLSVIAGFATPFVEPFLTKLIQPRLDEFPVHEGEYRTITFVFLLLGVAICCDILGRYGLGFHGFVRWALGSFRAALVQSDQICDERQRRRCPGPLERQLIYAAVA